MTKDNDNLIAKIKTLIRKCMDDNGYCLDDLLDDIVPMIKAEGGSDR